MKFESVGETGLYGGQLYGGLNVYRPFFDKDVHGHVVFRIVEGKRSSKDKGKYTQPNHNHPKRDLFMVGIRGTRIMNVNGKKYLLKPGHILCIEPGDHHYSPELGSESFLGLELWYSAPGERGF